MGEVPTKPGRGKSPVRNALDDTLRMDGPPPAPAAGPPDAPAKPADPPPATSAVGTQSIPVGERYRLGAELGRGGMGRVVEAFDVQLGRTVALKEVLPRGGPAIARRFNREVQLTARLEHPSIVPLYDAGTTADGRPFYVMRRVSGQPLDQLVMRATDLGERLTYLPALLAAIDAVGHAHRRGVIHRDIKPANILVGELGETVVIDWGLAKVIGEDDDAPGTMIAAGDSLRTQMGAVFGTPGFMAPEQARGEPLDPRGDVYALGATLYQLLAGAPPHAGSSASEVIARTSAHGPPRVDTIAPGAPPELVAIVGKALAFAPDDRYANAAALGEDVRRFLAGQLVAAHRYTPRQRVSRFTRRHRAALSVAAFAAVAVAALAWYGVARIVDARDLAERASERANAARGDAERALADNQRRTDQLVITQATGLLETNPTHAAAMLKELSASSARLGDARAAAQAAAVRGVAWMIPLDGEFTAYAELSLDGRFLIRLARTGTVSVWDLDHRRLVTTRSYPSDVHALWVGKKVLVAGPAPELIDPFTGAIQRLAVGPMSWAVASAAGDRVAFVDDHHAAHLLDVGRLAAQPLWPGHKISDLDLAIAADGSWIALSDRATVVVLDPTGRELTHRPGPAMLVFASRYDEVGFAYDKRVALCKLTPQPAWSEVDFAAPLVVPSHAAPPPKAAAARPAAAVPPLPVDFTFLGHELNMYMSTGQVIAWDGRALYERLQLTGLGFHIVETDHAALVAAGANGVLTVFNNVVRGELHLPMPLAHLKLVARPGVPRLLAIGDGAIVGFELADSLPDELALRPGGHAVFVDDDTLLAWRDDSTDWQWRDLRTGKVTAFELMPQGMLSVADVDTERGRVLIRESAPPTSETLILLHKNSKEVHRLVRSHAAWGRLLPGGMILLGVGDGRVFQLAEGEEPHELAKLDGDVDSAIGLGGSRYAAASARELVRGDLAIGALDRLPLAADGDAPTVVAAAPGGGVLVARDNRLLIWRTGQAGLVELARLDKRIDRITPTDGGALVQLADFSLVRAALEPGKPVRTLLAAASQQPLLSGDGRLALGESVNGRIRVVETPTGAAWELPAYQSTTELMTISPTTRRFIQGGIAPIAMWTLPLAPADLAPWLAERTNATASEATLVWAPAATP